MHDVIDSENPRGMQIDVYTIRQNCLIGISYGKLIKTKPICEMKFADGRWEYVDIDGNLWLGNAVPATVADDTDDKVIKYAQLYALCE